MGSKEFKYSVQFERFGDAPHKLLCSALELPDDFCRYFPVTTETGYISYESIATHSGLPEQEFWFAVVEAKQEEEAYNKAISNLLDAKLEKAFPAHIQLINDTIYK